MKAIRLTITLTFLWLLALPVFAQESLLIIGTYDSPASEGLYVFRFNHTDAKAEELSHIKTPNPSFVTVSPDGRFVYAVSETAPQNGRGGEVAAFSFDRNQGQLRFINSQLSGGDHPCHVELDKTGHWLFVSNYSSGTLAVLPVSADGSLGSAVPYQHQGKGPDPVRQKGPHAHGSFMSPDNKFVLTADLGIDKVMIYSFDQANGKLHPAKQPFARSRPGAGPRQLCFHPNNKYAYLIEELSGTVVYYKYNHGKLREKQRVSTRPPGDTSVPASADIHVSPDGKFLYASNRGTMNNISIYQIQKKGRIKLTGVQATLGQTPRYFSLSPDGQYLLCGNQNSDFISIFRRNQDSGLLTDTGNRIRVGKPVCIKWIPLK